MKRFVDSESRAVKLTQTTKFDVVNQFPEILWKYLTLDIRTSYLLRLVGVFYKGIFLGIQVALEVFGK